MNRITGSGSVEALGAREVGIIASTNELARDGHVVEPAGIDLSNYRKNPIVLWSHQPEQPVGACVAISAENNTLAARVQFAEPGISPIADEICALVKSGVVRGVSIGFQPTELEPLDPKDPWGGQHITAAELLEISFVSIPADVGAGVVARGFAARPGAMAMLRGLPRISRAAVERVMERMYMPAGMHRPVGTMNVYERARYYAETHRSHTTAVWASGQAREAELKARLAELETLRAIGESHSATRQ